MFEYISCMYIIFFKALDMNMKVWKLKSDLLFISQLLLNAEGTRFTQTKHEASVKFSRDRGLQELKYHLIPRTKGFIASLASLKAKCPSILDIQLVFKPNDPNEPTVGNLLHGRGVTGYMHVRRIDMKDLPDDETEAAEWMQQLFREKDSLQDSFLKHGDFFTGSGFRPVKPILQKATLGTLCNTIFWICVTLTPILYYLVQLLFSGKLLYLSIGVAILLVCKFPEANCAKQIHTINKLFLMYEHIFFNRLYSLPTNAEDDWNVKDCQRIIIWRRKISRSNHIWIDGQRVVFKQIK